MRRMAKITAKSAEQEAAERLSRLGMTTGASGHKVAVPPAAPTPAVTVAASRPVSEGKKAKDQRLCIIVSREQALKVKRYALENDTTVSDLLRGFIDSL